MVTTGNFSSRERVYLDDVIIWERRSKFPHGLDEDSARIRSFETVSLKLEHTVNLTKCATASHTTYARVRLMGGS